jgi:hypothetical protein
MSIHVAVGHRAYARTLPQIVEHSQPFLNSMLVKGSFILFLLHLAQFIVFFLRYKCNHL